MIGTNVVNIATNATNISNNTTGIAANATTLTCLCTLLTTAWAAEDYASAQTIMEDGLGTCCGE